MRSTRFAALGGITVFLLISLNALASKRDPADYPLRVHVYRRAQTVHYGSGGGVDFVDGTGRANLFENGQPKGFDFSFRCSQRLNDSWGYETYLARWKKPSAILEILMPVMGKPNATVACQLNVAMKDSMVYYTSNGLLAEEPAAAYKEWMEKVQYDPEHGKDEPVSPATAAPAAPAPRTP